jgi:hypothetical protein
LTIRPAGGAGQQRQQQLGKQERPELVGRPRELEPIRALLAAAERGTGVVDQDVDVVVPVLDLLGDPADVGLRGQVGNEQRWRFAGRGLGDPRAGVLTACLIAGDHYDLPALAGELPGRLESQPAAGTGDDDDLVPDRLLRRRRLAAALRRRSSHLKTPFFPSAGDDGRPRHGGRACPPAVLAYEPRPQLGERASRHLRD